MHKPLLLLLILIESGCAQLPPCGNPEGARVVLQSKDKCVPRIRQVIVGSDLSLPQSLKTRNFSDFDLGWVDSSMTGGRIEFGHFILTQKPPVQAKESPIELNNQ